MELESVLTVAAVADQVGLSIHTVYRAVREGELVSLELPGTSVYVTQAEVNAWLARRVAEGKRDGVLTPADGLRVVELAELAGTSAHTVRGWRKQGKLRASKVTGRLLVPWAEARRILEARGVDASDELERLQREKAAEAA